MLKTDLKDLTLFYDLEWVPDAVAARRLLDLSPETGESEAIEALWKYTDEEAERPFVKYLFSRVVSISFLSRKTVFRDGVAEVEFGLHSLPKLPLEDGTADEAYIIDRFLYFVGEREPHLVGFNSADSDIQVLIQRGMVNELSAPSFCMRPPKPWEGRDYFYRYSEEHLDLVKHLSNGQMKPKLHELARTMGLPGKIDANGEHVVDMWLAGDLRRIVEYNRIDTLNTYLVWLRFVHFCGKLGDEEYQSEQFQFRDFLEGLAAEPDGEYVARFLDRWEF